MYKEIRRNPDEQVRADYGNQFGIEETGVGWVLIVGNDTETEVKIGYSDNGSSRFIKGYLADDIFGASDVHFLAAVRGTQQNEDDIQTYFKKYNQNGIRRKTEFFKAADELCDYIAYLRSLYFVAITVEEMEMGRCIQPISFDLWRPNELHYKRDRAERDLLSVNVPWSSFPSRFISTMMDDYYTPEEILACVREALGGCIELDPASHVVANEMVKATVFYSETENGLTKSWSGCVFLNPPFSKWKVFSLKIVKELSGGDIKKMIVLANSRTITAQYFEPVLEQAKAICVLHGRYSFWGNEKDGSPSNGQVMLYFSSDPNDDGEAFRRAFAPIGITFHSATI